MKKCLTCGKIKDKKDGFYSNGYTEEGTKKYKPTCKECEDKGRSIRHLQRIIKALKSQGKELACEFCGYDKNYAAIEFHHIRVEDKKYRVSSMRSFSYDDVKKEIEKCLALCANCHRELHFPDKQIV